TRGLGRLRLTRTTVHQHALGTRAGILERLQPTAAQPADLRDIFVNTVGTDGADEIAIVVRWRPALPVMSKSEAEGVSVDALPMVTAWESGLVPVITGASFKGLLRAHGERICRTLLSTELAKRPAPNASRPRPDLSKDFLADLASCELIEAL